MCGCVTRPTLGLVPVLTEDSSASTTCADVPQPRLEARRRPSSSQQPRAHGHGPPPIRPGYLAIHKLRSSGCGAFLSARPPSAPRARLPWRRRLDAHDVAPTTSLPDLVHLDGVGRNRAALYWLRLEHGDQYSELDQVGKSLVVYARGLLLPAKAERAVEEVGCVPLVDEWLAPRRRSIALATAACSQPQIVVMFF